MSIIPVESGPKDFKNKWKWRIKVNRLKTVDKGGLPVIIGESTLPLTLKITTGTKEQEIELIDTLTSDRNTSGLIRDSVLYSTLKNEPDGLYRLVIYKQTNSSRLQGKEIYGFWSYCLVRKVNDIILFETRYFQCGVLNPRNLETRDPREDTRRKNLKDIPSGGVDRKW